MSDIKIQLKADKHERLVFAQGPNGEVVYIEAFPGLSPTDMHKFKERRDAVLEHDHHLKHPEEYITLKEVSSSEGEMLMGLPKLTGVTLAQNDMRKGIKVASAQALKDIKG